MNPLANLLCVMCGAELHGHMFTVSEGNVEMCRGLLRIAQAQMQLGARALAVRLEPDVSDTRALHVIIEGNGRTETFDAVIVATPLERASMAFIGFDPPLTTHRQREYRVMHVTHVSGHVNPAYFRKQHLWEIPPVILRADGSDTDFWGMGTVPRAQKSIYKIYSAHALSEHTLSQLFTRHTVVHHIERNAFPLLTPVHGWPPFILGPGLYYANAMEWAVSSMEMQAIASRNVVNALVEDLRLVGAPN